MSANLNTISNIIKEQYLPVLKNNITTEPSPFMEMIRKEPLTNNTVRLAAPVGINGGFGFGSEGAGTPEAGEQRYFDFEVKAVDMYVDMQISNKTVALASGNASSMLNVLDGEVRGSYAAAKWNIDMAASLSLGDKERDVRAGISAGVGRNYLLSSTATDSAATAVVATPQDLIAFL
jgi:hypothetical protein